MRLKSAKSLLFVAFLIFIGGCRLTTSDMKAALYNSVAPGMLEIPENATSVSFLQGGWVTIGDSENSVTKEPIDEQYDFDSSGAGTARIREKKTRQICTGRIQASIRGGVLELHRYNVKCPSGLTYKDQTFYCQKETIGTVCREHRPDKKDPATFALMKR